MDEIPEDALEGLDGVGRAVVYRESGKRIYEGEFENGLPCGFFRRIDDEMNV